MELNQEQLDRAAALKKQAAQYGRLMSELPGNVSSSRYRLVGQMREYFYMDEQSDDKKMTSFFKDEVLVDMFLDTNKITVFDIGGQILITLSTLEAVEEIIQIFYKKTA